MNWLIHFGAVAGNVALLAFAGLTLLGEGPGLVVAFCLVVSSLLSLAALAPAGKREERRLRGEVRLARLRKALRDLAPDA